MTYRLRLKESFHKFCLEKAKGQKLPLWIEKQVRLAQKRNSREGELLEKIGKLEKLLTSQELVEYETSIKDVPECDFLAVDLKTGFWYCDGTKIVPVVCKRRNWRLTNKENSSCVPKGHARPKENWKKRAVGSGKTEVNFPHGTVPFRYMKDEGWT